MDILTYIFIKFVAFFTFFLEETASSQNSDFPSLNRRGQASSFRLLVQKSATKKSTDFLAALPKSNYLALTAL